MDRRGEHQRCAAEAGQSCDTGWSSVSLWPDHHHLAKWLQFLWQRHLGPGSASYHTQCQAQGNVPLLLWRYGSGHLKGLLVMPDSRMRAIQHILKGAHGSAIQVSVPWICHVCLMGSSCRIRILERVRDPELGIKRLLTLLRQKRASSVDDLSMEPEWEGPSSSSIEGFVQCSAHWSHGQGIVVGANFEAKLGALWRPQKVGQLRRRVVKRREGDLSLSAAHPRLGIGIWGVIEPLS